MNIPIYFLGTSQAIPTETRNHTAILMNYKDESILMDCGEGTQRQFRKMHLNPCKVTRILISHWHGDHVLGLPGLMETLALNNYSKKLEIYGPPGTKNHVAELFKIFVPREKINYTAHEVRGKFLETDDFTITALPLDHGIPCNGYLFEEKDKLRINKVKLNSLKLKKTSSELGKLIQKKDITIEGKKIKYKDMTYLQKGKRISFILDTKICENIKKLAKNNDLMIIESTYTKNEEELAKEYKHMTAGQVAKIAKSQNVKELILTHISQRYEGRENIILDEAKKIFKNTKLAHDLMKIEI